MVDQEEQNQIYYVVNILVNRNLEEENVHTHVQTQTNQVRRANSTKQSVCLMYLTTEMV